MSSSKKTDDHIGGIAAVATYPRPQKRTRNFTREIAGAALRDLQAVVVGYFGGLVVGRLAERDRLDGGKGSLWLPLDRFTDLDERTLCHKLKIMPFLPTEWNSRRRDLFESSTGYRLTESVAEAQCRGRWPCRATRANHRWPMRRPGERVAGAPTSPPYRCCLEAPAAETNGVRIDLRSDTGGGHAMAVWAPAGPRPCQSKASPGGSRCPHGSIE